VGGCEYTGMLVHPNGAGLGPSAKVGCTGPASVLVRARSDHDQGTSTASGGPVQLGLLKLVKRAEKGVRQVKVSEYWAVEPARVYVQQPSVGGLGPHTPPSADMTNSAAGSQPAAS
jgi:hypothetical protein